jgi:nitrous oxide reductase accessory protein NosL
MKKTNILFLALFAHLFIFNPGIHANDDATEAVSAETRCSVCGMFVAKYPNWLATIHYDDPSQTRFFDGPKDMMVFYFNPEQYGGPSRETIKDIFVKDYYSLNQLPAKDAFYVIGSDIYGPMGHELIPFASRDAADSFLKDHHGKEVLPFDKITPELIESLREGQKMR